MKILTCVWQGRGGRVCGFFRCGVPCGAEGAGEDGLGRGREADVGHAHAAPASVDGEEDAGLIGEEGGLDFGGEHEVAVAEVL